MIYTAIEIRPGLTVKPASQGGRDMRGYAAAIVVGSESVRVTTEEIDALIAVLHEAAS